MLNYKSSMYVVIFRTKIFIVNISVNWKNSKRFYTNLLQKKLNNNNKNLINTKESNKEKAIWNSLLK